MYSRTIVQIVPAAPGWWAANHARVYPVALWLLVEETGEDGTARYVACDPGEQDGYITDPGTGADACWFDPRPATLADYLAEIDSPADSPTGPPGGGGPGKSDAGPPPLSRREGRGPAELPGRPPTAQAFTGP